MPVETQGRRRLGKLARHRGRKEPGEPSDALLLGNGALEQLTLVLEGARRRGGVSWHLMR